MRAKDIMQRQVIFVRNEEVLMEVINILMQHQISGVPVINENNQLVGVVSEKDLMTKEQGLNISSYMTVMTSILSIDGKKQLIQSRERLQKATAEEVMSTPAFAVHEDATVEEIVSLMMNRRINRIPVIDNDNKLIGIIGRTDLLPLLINR